MDINDIGKVFQNIISKKNIFLVIVVVLIFFISAIVMFGHYSSKAVNYKKENQQKFQKIDRVTEYNKSKEELKKFLASVTKPLGGDELVGRIEDYAIQNHINIVNIFSKDMQKHDDRLTMEIHMSIKVQDFRNLVSFFYNIETAPYSLKVSSWSGNSEGNSGIIDAEINIVATELNI